MFNAISTINVAEGFSLPLDGRCRIGRLCEWRAKARRYIASKRLIALGMNIKKGRVPLSPPFVKGDLGGFAMTCKFKSSLHPLFHYCQMAMQWKIGEAKINWFHS